MLGRNSTFSHDEVYIVSSTVCIDSVSRQQMPLLDCMDPHYDLGLQLSHGIKTLLCTDTTPFILIIVALFLFMGNLYTFMRSNSFRVVLALKGV